MARTALPLTLVAACAAGRASVPAPRAAAPAPSPAVQTASPAPLTVDAGATDAMRAPSPTPMSGDLPPIALDALRAAHAQECARGTCTVDGPRPDAPVVVPGTPAATPPARAWVQIIEPGATLVVDRRADTDLLGVVLTGHASLRLAESPRGAMQSAGPWTAFLLPESGAWIRASYEGPAGLVLIAANDPAHPHTPAQAAARRAPPRPRGGYVVRPLAETADLSWAGGAFHARIAFELPESPRASLEVLMGSADAPVAEHAHPTSWEVLLALQSAGTLRVPAQPAPGADGGAGLPTAEHAMATGSVAYVPIGLRHAWQPAGTVPLVAIQAYAPPGPEQRFRALAGMAPVDGGVAAGDAAAR